MSFIAHVSDFTKMKPEDVTLLGDYDYTSVMHYSPATFAKDKTSLKGRSFTVNRTWDNPFPESQEYRIGQRDDLTTLDLQKLRKLYQCGKYLQTLSTDGQHDRQHPKYILLSIWKCINFSWHQFS